MAFQSQVLITPGFGVQGEIYDNGPIRSLPYVINSSDATQNVYGRAFTLINNSTSSNQVTVGLTGNTPAIFAGYLVNPKAGVSYGTTGGGPLAPTLVAPNGVVGEFLTMGSIVVQLATTANVGDKVIFNNTTGALSAIAPTASVPTGSTYGYAVVDRFTASAVSGVILAVIKVTYVVSIPS